MKMQVYCMTSNAILPTRTHYGDLGYDLYCSAPILFNPGDLVLVPTDICIRFPDGYGGIIKDRSSVVTKQRLTIHAGVIDNGYTGHIQIAMLSSNPQAIIIEKGTKIAQLILVPVKPVTVEEVGVELWSHLIASTSDKRGVGGFGSTD